MLPGGKAYLCGMRHPLPAFVIDVEKVRRNLEVLKAVQEASGVKVLFALKGFASAGGDVPYSGEAQWGSGQFAE